MKFLTKRDLILVFLIFLVALAGFFVTRSKSDNEVKYAVFYVDNEEVFRVILDGKESEYEFGVMKIKTFSDRSAAIIYSDCPDQICVKGGRISKIGSISVCLPNKSFLAIEK